MDPHLTFRPVHSALNALLLNSLHQNPSTYPFTQLPLPLCPTLHSITSPPPYPSPHASLKPPTISPKLSLLKPKFLLQVMNAVTLLLRQLRDDPRV